MPEREATAAPAGTTFLAAGGDAAAVDDAAAAHGGVPCGDGTFAFPSAAAALAAAVAMRSPGRRLGVHAGDAMVDRGYRGPGVSRSRRLRELAAPGQTLVSSAAAQAAPPGTELGDLGVHRLRDLSPPLRLYALGPHGAAPRSLDAFPNNLPTWPTSFVGRAADLAELSARLSITRLLTIVGPGGSGKTRLAAQLAADLADRWDGGAWWVALEGLTDPAQLASSVAAALDVLVDPAAASLRAQLATRRLLLCLDNCEHVLAAAADLAGGLLRDCPEVSIVATSREPLGLSGETAWRLQPLPAADARALFLERAVAPGFPVGESAAVASMCTRLDGSPLALELAAAWARTLTPGQIEAGLDDRFSLLVRSPRDAVPRHATLLASIAWSYELLDEPDSAVMRRLAVFAGDFDVAAAQAVCAAEPAAVLASLARLVDKSLVVSRDGRHRLPETIRAYALDRLRAAGERHDATARLLAHLLALARELAPELERDKDRWRTTLAREDENLRAALEYGLAAEDPGPARRLTAELPWLWHMHRRGREGLDILRRAIARAPDERSALQARLLAGVALVADTADPLDVEAGAAARAAEMAAEQGNERLLALCLQLGAVGRLYTDLDATREASLEAEEVARRAGEAFVVDAGKALRGIVAHLRDEHDEATALLTEAAESLQARGDRGVASTALAFLSDRALATGDLAGARELAERSIAVAAPLADHLRIGMGRSALALVLGTAGDTEAGLRALAPVRALAGAHFMPEVNRALGLLHLWAGDAEQAERWLAVEAGSTDGGRPTYLAVRALPGLAAARRLAGRDEPARAAAAQGAALARERGLPAVLASALLEQARLDGDAALVHEALRIRAEHGLRPGIVECLEELAAAGDGEYAERLRAAAAAGRAALGLPHGRDISAMTLEEAAAYASRGRGPRADGLTGAEAEVVRLVVEGLSNPEIGARLYMSRGTVKAHLSRVYAKLGVANRTELAARFNR